MPNWRPTLGQPSAMAAPELARRLWYVSHASAPPAPLQSSEMALAALLANSRSNPSMVSLDTLVCYEPEAEGAAMNWITVRESPLLAAAGGTHGRQHSSPPADGACCWHAMVAAPDASPT